MQSIILRANVCKLSLPGASDACRQLWRKRARELKSSACVTLSIIMRSLAGKLPLNNPWPAVISIQPLMMIKTSSRSFKDITAIQMAHGAIVATSTLERYGALRMNCLREVSGLNRVSPALAWRRQSRCGAVRRLFS